MNDSMHPVVVGTGYVGLTIGMELAYLGHQVASVDNDHMKLSKLLEGVCPILEHGLATQHTWA